MPKRKKETIIKIINNPNKICSWCKLNKDKSFFHKDKNNLSWVYPVCKKCRKIRCNISYIKNIEHIKLKSKEYRKTDNWKTIKKNATKRYNEKYPEKYKAKYMVKNAIRDWKLIKWIKCEKCWISNVKLHCHHNDYSKPLEIEVLCIKCHNNIHCMMN